MLGILTRNNTSNQANEIEPYTARAFVSLVATLKPNEIQKINDLLKCVKLDNTQDLEVFSVCLNYKLECFNNRLLIAPVL